MQTNRRWALAWLLLGVAGCASTKLVDTWTDPAAPGAELSRIAIVYMDTNETSRRIAEDAAVRALTEKLEGVQVAPTYGVVPAPAMADQESMRQKLEQSGFDGILIIRPAGVQQRLVSVPGTVYPTFGAYWRWAYPLVYEPGYLYGGSYMRQETIVRLDTRLYSLKHDKLLWAGLSNTTDPSSINRLVRDVANTVAKALRKKDLLAFTSGWGWAA